MICWIYDWPSAGLLVLALTESFPEKTVKEWYVRAMEAGLERFRS